MANPKIFIVEDEHRIARFLQIELEHEGYDTALEDNGRHALDRILKGGFDLVLLDVMLPEMEKWTAWKSAARCGKHRMCPSSC